MKYLTTTFSLGMVNEETFLDVEIICKSQFEAETINAHPILNKEKDAEEFGVPTNSERIQLVPGDTLYVRRKCKRTLKSLYDTFMGREQNKYYKIQVIPLEFYKQSS